VWDGQNLVPKADFWPSLKDDIDELRDKAERSSLVEKSIRMNVGKSLITGSNPNKVSFPSLCE
jgi:hypothetical protein